MKIIRASEQRAMPWKNGGGTTCEVAVFPDAASLESFEWRVSMARVCTDGPFSPFPGIDRSLAILGGEGIVMHMGGPGEVALDRGSAPVSFAGEWPITATLRNGPVIDLNAMTRRDRWRHAMTRERLDGERVVDGGEAVLMIVAGGTVALGHHSGEPPLAFCDALVLRRGEQAVLRPGPAGADLVRIALSRVS